MSAEAPEVRWIDIVEVARMIRRHLRAQFPGVTFSVHSTRNVGGDYIDVSWQGGPSKSDVDAVLQLYDGNDKDVLDNLILRQAYILNGRAVASPEGAEAVWFDCSVFSCRR